MGNRFTKFKSNYLMRSQHQKTDVGTIFERDWVTTTGLNVLKFGSGRKVWYNSGNFVFTTSNIPTYQKKHKLSTETKEWSWELCKTSDGTSNEVAPNYVTKDLRDYAYYGSCLELVRATIEDIIRDFPGNIKSTLERPRSIYDNAIDVDDVPNKTPEENDVSYDRLNNLWYYYTGSQWEIINPINNEEDAIKKGVVGKVYLDLSDKLVKQLTKTVENGKTVYNFDSFGVPTGAFGLYFVTNKCKYYSYNYRDKRFNEIDTPNGYIAGFLLNNQFNIDLHHDHILLDDDDNPMRFMANSWKNYVIIGNNGKEDAIKSFSIIDGFEDKECQKNNEGKVIKTIKFVTATNKEYIIKAYYINGNIVYVYSGLNKEIITIQPKTEIIEEYFNSLKGFKKQLLRVDSKPLYTNKFVTPTEQDFVWYYPERSYTWPSDGYCLDINSVSFSTFVNRLFDMATNFDEMWSDNLYRSMTHESIKNFDLSYSREYDTDYVSDNLEGGERMKKIIRVFGRVFDDVKVYIDTLKQFKTVTYDGYKNGPQALVSELNSLSGLDIRSVVNGDFDLEANVNDLFLTNNVVDKKASWVDGTKSNHKKWYSSKSPNDLYPDTFDSEMMKRLNLSIPRIIQSKGTTNSIEMMFSLFGFERDVDYAIDELAFYTSKPIPSNECVDGTIDGKANYKGDDWSKTLGVEWSSISSKKKGLLANEINSMKDLDLLYFDDPLSGTPLRTVNLGRDNESFLVPYYDSSQLYDGDLYYQSKGGWGKMIKQNDNDPLDDSLDYCETLSYLHVVGTVSDLLSVNPYTVEQNSIYYVSNLNDYIEYDENPPMDKDNGITMSHYFILIDQYEPNKLYSWRNIVVKPTLDSAGNLQIVDNKNGFMKIFGEGITQEWAYSPTELPNIGSATNEELMSTYVYAFKKMQYLDSIISNNLGNNPHSGYGSYDDGNEFIESMKLPFKHVIGNSLIPNFSLNELAKKYSFPDIDKNIINDKIQILNSRVSGSKKSDYKKYIVSGDNLKSVPSLNGDNENVKKRWFINTKVLTITNKVSSPLSYKVKDTIIGGGKVIYHIGSILSETDYNKLSDVDKKKCIKYRLFDEYFKTVMLPYIMQVVPSTTILRLKNFSE